MTSQIQRIADLNYIAGNYPVPDWDALGRQINLIELEFNEIKEAYANRDTAKLRDGIADVHVTTGGLSYRLGVNGEEDLALVVDCLYTRFDLDEESQKLTAKKYADLGVSTYCHVANIIVNGETKTYYVTKVKETCVGTNGEKYPQHKWLKSVYTQEPGFESPTVFSNLETIHGG